MTIWIPGIKGLVGSYLASQLTIPFVGSGHEVDISNESHVRQFIQQHGPFTQIINCAAFSTVDPAESKKEEAFLANAIGPEVLGKIAREQRINLLHLSTDYVFSGSGKTSWKESDKSEPCNYYGYSKLEGEKRLLSVYPESTILRTSWIYGTGGKNFVAKLIGLLQTVEELRLVDDQISRPTYVPDLVSIILKMIHHPGLYQFANEGPTSKYAFALALKEEALKLGIPIRCRKITPCLSSEFPAPAKRPLNSSFDTTKIESLLHFKPRHWKQTLAEYLENCEKIPC